MAFGWSIPSITGGQDDGFSLSPDALAVVRQMMSAAPAGGSDAGQQPTATQPQSMGGGIQDRFVGALRDGGLTNPNGLGAVAAYAQHESRYSPSNINGSWSDPSESGQAGTSGGILSWRADRLANMRAFTQGAADPVVAQAKFTLAENPSLTRALQAAKSPEEANALMADAWKFAGYNRPGGGEYAARLATTQSFANRLGSGQPMQMPGATNAPAAFGLAGPTQGAATGTRLSALGGTMTTPEASSPSADVSSAAPAAPATDPSQGGGQGKGGQKQQGGASPMQFRTVRPRPFGFMSPMQFAGQNPRVTR